MLAKLKSTSQILVGIVLVFQLAGCIFVNRNHRRHYDSPQHHDPGVDVRVHG